MNLCKLWAELTKVHDLTRYDYTDALAGFMVESKDGEYVLFDEVLPIILAALNTIEPNEAWTPERELVDDVVTITGMVDGDIATTQLVGCSLE